MFKHYLTSALRHFRQHKLTTSINLVCLTIGLVCFLAIYATVTYLGSADRHYANADRTYTISAKVGALPSLPFSPWLLAKFLRVEAPELQAVARATFDTGFASQVPVTAADRKSFAQVAYADPSFSKCSICPFSLATQRPRYVRLGVRL